MSHDLKHIVEMSHILNYCNVSLKTVHKETQSIFKYNSCAWVTSQSYKRARTILKPFRKQAMVK